MAVHVVACLHFTVCCCPCPDKVSGAKLEENITFFVSRGNVDSGTIKDELCCRIHITGQSESIRVLCQVLVVGGDIEYTVQIRRGG